METIQQFCTMWQNLFTDPKHICDYVEMDLENFIEWAKCCESTIVDELRLVGDQADTADVTAFNREVALNFPYLPPSPSYAHDLANSRRNIVKALLQNPYLSDHLLNHMIRILSKNDSVLSESIESSIDDSCAQKSFLEFLLNHEAFADVQPLNLAQKTKASLLAKRLMCLWQVTTPKSDFESVLDESDGERDKVVKEVLAAHLDEKSPLTCLYLLYDIHHEERLSRLVYSQTISVQYRSFSCGPEADEILASVASKYPSFFQTYLLYLLKKVQQIEGLSLEDAVSINLNSSGVKRRIAELSKASSRLNGMVRRLLSERRDRSGCENREVYNELLREIS